jgi:hypothetical protein
MGEKGKTLFMHVVVDLKKTAPLQPDSGLRSCRQDGPPEAWNAERLTLKITRRASNKHTIPPGCRIFTPVLRFIAPASVILAPARKNY